jgi:hypothetical protein
MNSDHIELVKGKQIRVSKETYILTLPYIIKASFILMAEK